jgi:hypothetical protein
MEPTKRDERQREKRRIARREFVAALGAAAVGSGLAGPLATALAAQKPPEGNEAQQQPQNTAQSAGAAGNTAAAPVSVEPESALPGIAIVPGMTAEQRERVRGVIERDAERRKALHTPPLPYDLEPAFLFRARPAPRRRIRP